MTNAIAGLKIGDKLLRPAIISGPPETVEIIGFRYYTSRHNGRTSMVADYVGYREGKPFSSFDGIDRVLEWQKLGTEPTREQLLAFVTMIARCNTEEEQDENGVEDVSSDCIETLNSLIVRAREMTGETAPPREEDRDEQ